MRARSIKPGLLANEVLGTADPLYTLLFEALWMMADREGRLEDRPLRIKAQAFPYREGLDCDVMLNWLAEHHFITRYSVADQRFIQVLKFGEHQHPHVKEPTSKIPAPDSPGASPVQAPDKHQTDTSAARLTPSSLTPDSGLLTADSSSLRSPPDRAAAQPEPGEFVELRRDFPKRAGSHRWQDALGAYRARLHEGTTPQAILSGVRRYAAFIRATGKEGTEYVQQAATFLGKNRGFELPWHPPAKPETAGERLMRTLNGDDDSRVIEHDPAFPALTGH
jgi:hypothetical protein